MRVCDFVPEWRAEFDAGQLYLDCGVLPAHDCEWVEWHAARGKPAERFPGCVGLTPITSWEQEMGETQSVVSKAPLRWGDGWLWPGDTLAIFDV